VPQVVKTDGPDARDGPELGSVLRAAPHTGVCSVLTVLAPTPATAVAVALDDARAGQRAAKHVLEGDISPHHLALRVRGRLTKDLRSPSLRQ